MADFDEINDEADRVTGLFDEKIKTFIESKLDANNQSDINRAVINNALTGIKIPINTSNPIARVTQYCNEFF